MVQLDGYYCFDATEIAYVRKVTISGVDHPYRLYVGVKGGQEYGVNYATEKMRNDAYTRFVSSIERERREPIERLRWELGLIQSTLKTIDKRQMKIWRQLRNLLDVKVEE